MKKYILSAGIILMSVMGYAQTGRLIAQKSGKTAVLEHEVQPKEGLYTLSRLYAVKVADIAAANGFARDKGLVIGEKVKIPLTAENLTSKKGKTPIYYAVTDGETLTGISNRFNKIPIKDLKALNNLDSDILPKDRDMIVGYLKGGTATSATASTTATTKPSATLPKATVTGTNINIRKGPSTDQEVVAIAQLNDIVEVVKKVNSEWTSIRTQDGKEGFVASQFLQAGVVKIEPKAAPVKKATVSGSNINVRKGPSTDQEVVAILQQNDIVEVTKEVNSEWSAIKTPDGTEGFMVTRFLQAPGSAPAAAEPPKTTVLKTAVAYGTNINIRKGPSTDQEVVGMAKADETLTYLKKVDNDWSEVQSADGTQGFVATRFLSFDGKPSVASIEAEQLAQAQAEEEKRIAAENEKAAAAAARQQEENEKATASVKEAAPQPTNTGIVSIDEAGYFKSDFEKYKNPNLLSEHTLSSGIFKTDRGWSDGRYYLLMDNAAPGTIVKLTNPGNNKSVYAKVLGKMKGVQYSEGFDIRISEAAAKKIEARNLEKFDIMVTY